MMLLQESQLSYVNPCSSHIVKLRVNFAKKININSKDMNYQ